MATMPDLSPIAWHQEGGRLVFVLQSQDEILPQLANDFEHVLSERLAGLLAADTPLEARIDLQNLPAINSRQLGSLIALSKVLRPRLGAVALVGISPTVRHLLKLTKTDQLFKLE